jgi:chemotaxis protein CheD
VKNVLSPGGNSLDPEQPQRPSHPEDVVLDPTSRTVAPTPAAGQPAPEPLYVPPGRLAAIRDGQPLTTIVSTGAVVCVWDSSTGVGGMAHFLLPESGCAPPALRFGDVALRSLLDELEKLGAPTKRLRARVFGGSAPPIATSGAHLGDRNIEAAHAFLKSQLVPVLEKQAGGTGARKVVFAPDSGQATVTRVGANG